MIAVIALGAMTALSACGKSSPAAEPDSIAPAADAGQESAESAAEPETTGPVVEPEASGSDAVEEVTETEETAVQKLRLTTPLTIACVGDSITYGDGVKETREVDSYPARLQALFYEAGYDRDDDRVSVINYGVCGKTLMSTGDKPYSAAEEYRESLKAAADIYILMLGTNDAKPFNWSEKVFEEELPAFWKEYEKAQTGAGKPVCLVVMKPPCVFEVEGEMYPYGISGKILKDYVNPHFDAALEEMREDGLIPVDLNELTCDHPEWFPDGVHPNAEGNQAIAQAVYDAINAAIGF